MSSLNRVGPRAFVSSFVFLSLALCTRVSSAQLGQPDAEIAPAHEEAAEHAKLPLRLSERPLTLPRGKVVLTSSVGLEYLHFDELTDCVMTISGPICIGDERDYDHDIWRTSAGVAVGAIDALEVGLVPLRLREGIGPEGGRELVRDPLLYVRAAALRLELFQLGFGYQILLPLRSDTTLMTQSISLDLLARSRFVRGEAAAFVRFDSPVRKRTSLTVSERIITPGVAARLTGQIADPFAVFFGFQSSFFHSSIEGHVTNIDTGFVGTVRRSAGEPVADIRFTFGALDVKREEEPGVTRRDDTRTPCELTTGDGCGDVARGLVPVKRYTFELSATFYFHDAW